MRSYFSPNTLKFIKKASRQKSPAWLDKNRSEYESVLLEPLQELAAHLKQALANEATGYHFPQKGIGRLKRSQHRVQAGERPAVYKNWISYSASRPARSRFEKNPSLYFGLHPDDEDGDTVIVAGGLYMPSSSQLRAVREAIAADATPFEKLFALKSFSRQFKGGFSKDHISSRVPRGFDPNHPRLDWLRLQAFFVWRAYSLREFKSPGFAALVTKDWKEILRLNALLDQAIGSSGARTAFKANPVRKKSAEPLISRLEELDVVVHRPDFD